MKKVSRAFLSLFELSNAGFEFLFAPSDVSAAEEFNISINKSGILNFFEARGPVAASEILTTYNNQINFSSVYQAFKA